jgi:hypothetical protein
MVLCQLDLTYLTPLDVVVMVEEGVNFEEEAIRQKIEVLSARGAAQGTHDVNEIALLTREI